MHMHFETTSENSGSLMYFNDRDEIGPARVSSYDSEGYYNKIMI